MHLLSYLSLVAAAASPTAAALRHKHAARDISVDIDSTLSTESGSSYWLENIKHQGIAPFNANASSYQVFRNVKDFGAKGDGDNDDTQAIQQALASGERCAPSSCNSSSTTPAVVYFPCGTYLVTDSIIDYYNTMIIGNPECMPTIKASSNFTARWVIDGNQYQSDGDNGWNPTNVFWTQIRNFVIDMTSVNASLEVSGVQWTVSQATSLQNIVFKMSQAEGNLHEGVFMAEGSGGFLADLVFYGGNYGMTIGNQQYTMRNLTFHNAYTAINQLWDWGWTYSGLSINNCTIGIDMSVLADGVQQVAGVVLIDSEITNTDIGVLMARNASSTPASGGSLIIENVALNNVKVAVQGPHNSTAVPGSSGSTLIKAWGQGHAYTTSNQTRESTFQNNFAASNRPASLTNGGSGFFARPKPQYEGVPVSQFISVRDQGAKGDGTTDDTAAVQAALDIGFAQQKIVFFDAGYYKVTNTIRVHRSARIVGEAFAAIMSSGSYFADMDNPQPVVQLGAPGEIGSIEWSDMFVSTQGAQAGAILIEYNLDSPADDPSGMWDVHTRIGGFAGSKLQVAECPTTPNTTVTSQNLDKDCIAAYMSMYITKLSSGLYMEGNWLWTADHDVDDANNTQITIYTGRGLLVESTAGNIWMYGTGVEHHQLYQYQLVGTKDVMMGQIQTETAYWQPNPGADIPFPAVTALNDPVLGTSSFGWGLRVIDSQDIMVYGAGLYSFFNDYSTTCSDQGNPTKCQKSIMSIDNQSKVSVYNLNTVGTTDMITVDGQALAEGNDNQNGYVDTIAWFTT
ncbi:putative Exo-beta-1,3-glucanae [Xylariaceae sp. FL0804]|nr:putative Exo-beta-1,3-glucanae [Xylariaceae sp. FL0804]